MRWVYRSMRDPPVRREDVWTAATIEGSIAWIKCGGKVQEAGIKGEGTGRRCARLWRKRREKVFANVSQRALTKRRTLGGSSVLERPDSAILRQVKREQFRVRSIEAAIL